MYSYYDNNNDNTNDNDDDPNDTYIAVDRRRGARTSSRGLLRETNPLLIYSERQ